jgi:CcmD family protein
MNGNSYLYAAFAATWIIHVAYLTTLAVRYSKLRREIESLRKK